MEREIACKVQDFCVELAVDAYIRDYRDAGRFMPLCGQCENYNRSWACPPFNRDLEKELRRFANVLLVASKIMPLTGDLPVGNARILLRPHRSRLERRLLDMEKQYGGRSLAYAGNCLFCAPGSCTRPSGLPCRHPELARPSLEAYGFDIGRTVRELFGFELLWGREGRLPEYLTLVCGFFHNAPSVRF